MADCLHIPARASYLRTPGKRCPAPNAGCTESPYKRPCQNNGQIKFFEWQSNKTENMRILQMSVFGGRERRVSKNGQRDSFCPKKVDGGCGGEPGGVSGGWVGGWVKHSW